MANLQAFENEVLAILQQPQVNYGAAPNWAGFPNLPINQASVDNAINQGYINTMRKLADIELYSYTIAFPSVAQAYAYAVPPPITAVITANAGAAITQTMLGTPQIVTPASMANIAVGMSLLVDVQPGAPPVLGFSTPEVVTVTAITPTTFTTIFYQIHQITNFTITAQVQSPPIQKIQRVYYAPIGQTYTREQMPGVSLIDWQTFQGKYTAGGYYRQFSFGTEPQVCSLSPDRLTLNFYPGSTSSGDAITIAYMPIPTAGTLVPTLSAETDVPVLPDDCYWAIVNYACSRLWPRLREMEAAAQYKQMFDTEILDIKENLAESTKGVSMRFTTAEELYSGPYATFGPAGYGTT